MVMHELFSLQIDIDALNPRSSLILYFQGSVVSEFQVLKTYHIHFSSHLSFAAHFYFPWLIFWIFLFGTHLDSWSMPSLFTSHHQHHLGIVDIVASTNLHPVWEASFIMLLPAFPQICLFTNCSTSM
jgi:hypothetical protein